MFQLFLIIVVFSVFYVYYKNRKIYKAGENFPGPKAYPLLGNSLDFASSSYGIFLKINEFSQKYGRFFRIWNNGKLFVICNEYKDAEVLLNSNVHLQKSDTYKFLYPWIGEGLISASDIPYWRKHRKIITPTFHFKILYDFLEVFNQNAKILCEAIAPEVMKGSFDVYNYVKLMALDNICETAMGVNVNAQRNSESEYVRAVKDMTHVLTMRFFKVWLMIDFFFYLSKYAKIQKECLKVLHTTTHKLIQERREQFKKQKKDNNNNTDERRKLAFLDILLESEEGFRLSDKELREEVDTFMFAGHDTISSGISFTLYCLAQNEQVQDLAYKEQITIFGNSNQLPTYADIQEMKYLEMVLKEVQRMYPSVPFIGRDLKEDLYLPGNHFIPKGTQLILNIFSLHHDPNVFPEPEKFNPDNFLPEAIQSRSPYAFIPFSAGPRNCIGQKYAMLAMKATISAVLRHYKVLPSPHPHDKLNLAAEIVLVPLNGIYLQIKPRN